jgi:hypothetical protein
MKKLLFVSSLMLLVIFSGSAMEDESLEGDAGGGCASSATENNGSCRASTSNGTSTDHCVDAYWFESKTCKK